MALEKFNLAGLPVGDAIISAGERIGGSDSIEVGPSTVTIGAVAPQDIAAHFVGQEDAILPVAEPFTVTINDLSTSVGQIGFEAFEWRGLTPALGPNFREHAQPASGGNVILADDYLMGNRAGINFYTALGTGVLDGGWADVYRYNSGTKRLDLVRQSEIVEFNPGAYGTTLNFETPAMVAPGVQTYQVRIPSTTDVYPTDRPVPYYVWIRAVDGTALGPVSNAYNAAISATTSTTTNTTVAAPSPAAGENGNPDYRSLDATLPAPTVSGSVANDIITITWTDAADARVEGYAVFYSPYPPERAYPSIVLADDGGAPVQPGDIVVYGKTITDGKRERVSGLFGWGTSQNVNFRHKTLEWWDAPDGKGEWEMTPYGENLYGPDGGSYFCRFTLAEGETRVISLAENGGGSQPPLGHSMTLKTRARHVSGANNQIVMELGGAFATFSQGETGPQTKTLTTDWTNEEITIFRPVDGEISLGGTGFGRITLTGPCVVDLDAAYIDRTNSPTGALLSSMQRYAADVAPVFMRAHQFIKCGTDNEILYPYSMSEMFAGFGARSTRGVTNGWDTLHNYLECVRGAGCWPWVQLEVFIRPDEWTALAEWLCAPYDPATDTPAAKPWAHKRHVMGQTAPWIDEFDHWRFELGNEMWNPLFRPFADFGASNVAGLHVRMVETMRSSPYWTADAEAKTDWVFGSWATQMGAQAVHVDVLKDKGATDYFTVAAYLSGWDSGDNDDVDPDDSTWFAYHLLAAFDEPLDASSPYKRRRKTAANAAKIPAKAGSYEAGPGYTFPNANRDTALFMFNEHAVRNSKIIGVAQVDQWLDAIAAGWETQNFFVLQSGSRWSTHSRYAPDTDPEKSGLRAPHPAWYMTRKIAPMLRGGSVRKVHQIKTAFHDFVIPAAGDTTKPASAPVLTAYLLANGTTRQLIVVNRSLPWTALPEGDPNRTDPLVNPDDTGFIKTRVDLPWRTATSVKLWKLTGNWNSHNFGADDTGALIPAQVGELEVDLTPPANCHSLLLDTSMGLTADGVPPAEVLIWTFEGVSNAEAEPVAQITSVDLQAQQPSGDVAAQIVGDDGTYSWVLVTADPAVSAPSVAQVEAGQDHTGAAAPASGSTALTNGAPATIALPSGLNASYYLVMADGDSVVYDATPQAIDTTAPALSGLSGTAAGATTMTAAVTSTEAGGAIYFGVRPSASAALTAAQLVAGAGGAGVAWDSDATPTADGTNAASFSGLTASTAYRVDAVHVDAFGTESAVVSSAEVATDAGTVPLAFVAGATAIIPANATTAINLPAGASEGDVVFVMMGHDDRDNLTSNATRESTFLTNSWEGTAEAFALRVGAGQTSINVTNLNATKAGAIAMAAFEGLSDPLGIVDGPDVFTGFGTGMAPPPQTATAADQLLLWMWWVDDRDNVLFNQDALDRPAAGGLTMAANVHAGEAAGSSATVAIAYKITTGAETIDVGTAAQISTGEHIYCASVIVE